MLCGILHHHKNSLGQNGHEDEGCWVSGGVGDDGGLGVGLGGDGAEGGGGGHAAADATEAFGHAHFEDLAGEEEGHEHGDDGDGCPREEHGDALGLEGFNQLATAGDAGSCEEEHERNLHNEDAGGARHVADHRAYLAEVTEDEGYQKWSACHAEA